MTEEAALEPELPIIDAHHHLWDKHPTRPLVGRYMIEEIAADVVASGHSIVKTVYMQSSSAGWRRADGPEELRVVGESEFVQGVAVMAESGLYTDARVGAGIVGTVDLTLGAAAEPVLLAHRAAARGFRGVRFRGGKAESIDFDDPAVLDAARALERLGLVYDCNGPETHPLAIASVLGGLCRLARACPSLVVVVDHCGGAVGPACFDAAPAKRAEWEAAVTALAACENVYMKVGGLQMQANGFGLGPESRDRPVGSAELMAITFPYYSFVIRAFGARRCMFESNFPVDKTGVGYGVLWNTFKLLARRMQLSAGDKAAIFHDTAARVYGLE
jgi:predicted TIM-barrel fold metal-dependent hydrolase